jgi:hypothetical protein
MARVGERVQTTAGTWITKPPSRCAHGHPLGPGQVLVGHIACMGHGGGGLTPRGSAEPAMTLCTGRRSMLTAGCTPALTGVEGFHCRLYNMLGGAVDVCIS